MEKLESLSLVDINNTIGEAVEKIRCTKEKSSRFVPWSDKTDLEIAKEQGSICCNDNFYFRANGEVRDFFGLNNTNSQRCFYKINEMGSHLWLPHLAIELDIGEMVAGSSYGYINLYSMKDGIIYEHLVHMKKRRKDLAKSMRESENG